jgi:hypothetical protein
MVDIIRRGVEVIGQQYVNGRMTGRSAINMGVTHVKTDEEIRRDDEKMTEAIVASPVV